MEAPHLKAVATVVRIFGIHVRAIEHQSPGVRAPAVGRAGPNRTLAADECQHAGAVVAVARGGLYGRPLSGPFRENRQ